MCFDTCASISIVFFVQNSSHSETRHICLAECILSMPFVSLSPVHTFSYFLPSLHMCISFDSHYLHLLCLEMLQAMNVLLDMAGLESKITELRGMKVLVF